MQMKSGGCSKRNKVNHWNNKEKDTREAMITKKKTKKQKNKNKNKNKLTNKPEAGDVVAADDVRC